MSSLVPPDPDQSATAAGERFPPVTVETYKRMVELWSRQNWLRPGTKKTFDVQIPRAYARELFTTYRQRFNIVIQPTPLSPTARMFLWRDTSDLDGGIPDTAA